MRAENLKMIDLCYDDMVMSCGMRSVLKSGLNSKRKFTMCSILPCLEEQKRLSSRSYDETCWRLCAKMGEQFKSSV